MLEVHTVHNRLHLFFVIPIKSLLQSWNKFDDIPSLFSSLAKLPPNKCLIEVSIDFHYPSISQALAVALPLKTLPLQKSNECILRIRCHSFGTNAIGFDCQLVGYFWKPTPFNWLRLMSLHSHENHYIVPSFTIVNDCQGGEHFPLSILYS